MSNPTHLPLTPDTLHATYTCSVCNESKTGDHFVALSTPRTPEGVVYPKNKRYDKRPRRKRIIDPSVCRACKARKAASAYNAKVRAAKIEHRRQCDAEIERRLRMGIEMDPALLPKKRGPKTKNGSDPVLWALTLLINQNRKQDRAESEREAELVTRCNELPNEEKKGYQTLLKYIKWKRRLYEARAFVFEKAQAARRHDLMNPITAHDPQRLHWLAYIEPEDKLKLEEVAHKVNRFAVPNDPSTPEASVKGRRFVGLPAMRAMQIAVNGEKTAVLHEQWREHREAVTRTKKNSIKAIRNQHGTRGGRFRTYSTDPADSALFDVPDGHSYKFTMEEFHMRRIAACDAALKQIDAAVIRGESPAAWTSPWHDEMGERYASNYNADSTRRNVVTVTSWRHLVPPLAYAELKAMHAALPDNVRKAMVPFPKYDRRTATQRLNNWTVMNTIMPLPAPAFVKERVSIEEVVE